MSRLVRSSHANGAVGSVAERAGFEPAVPVPRNTRSPGAPVQPLRHLSYGPALRYARQEMPSTRSAQPGGEGGIRTRDTRNGYTGFRDRRFQPLSHLSGPKIVSKAKKGLLLGPAASGNSIWPIPPVLRVDTFKTPYLALSGQLRAQNVIRTCSKSMKPHVFRPTGSRRHPALSDPDSALAVADPRPEEVGSAE